MCRLYAACLLVFFSAYSASQPAKSAGNTVKDKYQVIEVGNFEIQKGVDLPPDYFAKLQDELVKQLTESQKFKAVLLPEQSPPAPDLAVLRLTGVVTGFKEGSRAKRYFVGFGAGTSQIFARAKYSDRATGQTVIEEEVIGTLKGGLFGGDSKNVLQDFAKALVTMTKLTLLKPLPPPVRESGLPVASAGPIAKTESTKLNLKAGDVDANEKELNALAVKGFRITNYTSTGEKTATLTLEKNADSLQSHTYRLLHTKLVGNLQKDLGKAAAEGYRFVPHTLAYLGGYFLVAEKPTTATSARYEYRVHVAMRVSNAEKDIKEDQARGFALADTAEMLQSMHMVILEKPIAGTTLAD